MVRYGRKHKDLVGFEQIECFLEPDRQNLSIRQAHIELHLACCMDRLQRLHDGKSKGNRGKDKLVQEMIMVPGTGIV